MMNKSEQFDTPFEFDSPVEFILIATIGKKRSVIVKSKGAQIDLVAYAQKNLREDELTHYIVTLFPKLAQLKPLSVDSAPSRHIRCEDFDNRQSEYTIVWRGAAYSRHLRKIEKELQKNTLDIIDALDQRSYSRTEWSLAPVIDQCNRATLYIKAKRLRLVSAFWFVLLIYGIAIAWFAIRSIAL